MIQIPAINVNTSNTYILDLDEERRYSNAAINTVRNKIVARAPYIIMHTAPVINNANHIHR